MIIANLALHGFDIMSQKQTSFTLSGSNPKVKDDDYFQSKNASLFKLCAGLRFSGYQDYDTFLEKFYSILSISGFLNANGVDIINDNTSAESAVYDCIVCLSSSDALTFITAMKTQSKHSGSALLALLESEFGSSTEANQLAVQAQLHAVAFSGDLKGYLLRLDLLRRKLTGSFVLPYSTLLHIVKNACIHTFQMEIKPRLIS